VECESFALYWAFATAAAATIGKSQVLQGCQNRPDKFPGWTSYKATKPGFYVFHVYFVLKYFSADWCMSASVVLGLSLVDTMQWQAGKNVAEVELRFYFPLDTTQVISETFFLAKLLALYWRN